MVVDTIYGFYTQLRNFVHDQLKSMAKPWLYHDFRQTFSTACTCSLFVIEIWDSAKGVHIRLSALKGMTAEGRMGRGPAGVPCKLSGYARSTMLVIYLRQLYHSSQTKTIFFDKCTMTYSNVETHESIQHQRLLVDKVILQVI